MAQPMPVEFQASPQQQNFFDFVTDGQGNATLIAVAGSGKTETLARAAKLMNGYVNIAAYNKKAADELNERLKRVGAGRNVRAGTFHSFGFNAWRRLYPAVVVDERKLFKICSQGSGPELAKGGQAPLVNEDMQPFVCKTVAMAKQRAFGVVEQLGDMVAWRAMVEHFGLDESLPDAPDDLTRERMLDTGVEMALLVLKLSIAQDREVIDYDDMIFAPLYHEARLWQNDWVLVDEAQDTNPARRALAKKMLKPGGRFVAVGDPHQAIYGFTGADNDALQILATEFHCQSLLLTVSFRCPQLVVDRARYFVSHIEANPNAPRGFWGEVNAADFAKLTPAPIDAVLCRYTKPLVALAYQYIRRGVGCHVEGKDIGRGLMALVSKWSASSCEALYEKLQAYRRREVERAMAAGEEQKAEAVADKVESLLVIMDALPDEATIADLRTAISRLFDDTPEGTPARNLTLSTIHRSKGREWDRVYWYGGNVYQPSAYARQQWQQEQELNLQYVAATRAKRELVEVIL